MKKFISLIIFFIYLPAFAYIPNLNMVLSRTAKNHGNKPYSIEQEVVFQNSGNEPYLVKETWIIENDNKMRLHAVGERALKGLFQLTAVYSFGKKYYIDTSGQKRVADNVDEWIEPIFHFRNVNRVKQKLVRLNILPKKALGQKRVKLTLEKPIYEKEDFVRLARSGGSISYSLGQPTPAGSELRNPGLWIEQDQFLINKLRLPAQVEVTATKHNRYTGGLWLPQTRHVVWGNHDVQINLRRVKGTWMSKENKIRLNHYSLNAKKNPEQKLILPDIEVIKTFYKRFR